MTRKDNLRHVRSKGKRAIFGVDYSYIFALERLTKMTMNKRQTEYIALYLFVFGAILLFGVLARKFVLVKGYDEFSAAVGFFATVVVLSALYISLQMTLNELLLPRIEEFLMRFPAFQKLEEVVVVAETTAIVAEPIEEVAVAKATPQPTEYEVLRANAIAEANWIECLTIPSRLWSHI